MNTESEEFALEQERLYLERRRVEKEIIDKYKELILESIEKKDDNSKQQLIELFNNGDFNLVARSSNELAEIAMIVDILKIEVGEGEEKTILDVADGADNLLRLLRKIKYLLFRIEFIEVDENVNDIFELVCDKRLSPYVLAKMVEWTNYNKCDIYRILAQKFKIENMLRYAFTMLLPCNEIETGNEETLIQIADLFSMIGQYDDAMASLREIDNPSYIVGELYEQYCKKSKENMLYNMRE